MSDPLSRPAALSARHRECIPERLRREILDEEVCAYCSAAWASVVDHVIPIAQGGLSVPANLVPACNRCNAQKSGKTPAQWKAWRLARGMSWPPPNCQMKAPELILALSEAEAELLSAAIRAANPPLMAAAMALHDRHHINRDRPADEDRAELLALASEYQAAVAV